MKFRKIIVIFIIFLMTLSLTACGKKPEDSVKGFLDAYSKTNFKEAYSFLLTDEEFNKDDLEEAKFFIEPVCRNIKYKIIETTMVDENTAIVKTEITNLNLKPIIANTLTQYMKYALEMLTTGKNPSEEEAYMKLVEIYNGEIAKDETEYLTRNVNIDLVKTSEGLWKIRPSLEFGDAISGNFVSALEELNNLIK